MPTLRYIAAVPIVVLALWLFAVPAVATRRVGPLAGR